MFNGGGGRRVLLIGLDSAEAQLIEEGMAAGWLPHLRQLRDGGAYGRLTSTTDRFDGSVWVTFFTGTGPQTHGHYHWQQWRSEKMERYRCSPDWLPMQPFWRSWGADAPRTIALDVPKTYCPTPFNGIEVSGLVSHDRLAVPFPASYPPTAARNLMREFGPSPLTRDTGAAQTYAHALAIRDRLIAATGSVERAAAALMHREAWDLCVVVFVGPHRGGHVLWDATGLMHDAPPEAAAALPEALRDVYAACDASVGRLVHDAGPDTTVLVFSLNGMGPDTSLTPLLGQMLSLVLSSPDGEGGGALQRLREMVPERYRLAIKDCLPIPWQEALGRFWRRRKMNWRVTRAFAIESDPDPQGYIRINLRGRERLGIVEPGEPFERLCEEISEGLRSFADADSGEPVVEDICRPVDVYPAGARSGGFPDLLVRWSDRPVVHHRAIHSPRFGTIPWPTAGRHPLGRPGGHTDRAFLLAHGPGVEPGAVIDNAHLLDLAPTVHALLGLDVPSHMEGRSLVSAWARSPQVAEV